MKTEVYQPTFNRSEVLITEPMKHKLINQPKAQTPFLKKQASVPLQNSDYV